MAQESYSYNGGLTAPFSMTLNYLNISEMDKDTAIVTMKGEWETVIKLSNGTIFNDLE